MPHLQHSARSRDLQTEWRTKSLRPFHQKLKRCPRKKTWPQSTHCPTVPKNERATRLHSHILDLIHKNLPNTILHNDAFRWSDKGESPLNSSHLLIPLRSQKKAHRGLHTSKCLPIPFPAPVHFPQAILGFPRFKRSSRLSLRYAASGSPFKHILLVLSIYTLLDSFCNRLLKYFPFSFIG